MLSDGSAVATADYTSSSGTPVAVICGFKSDGLTPIGLGLVEAIVADANAGNTPDARWCTDDYIDYYDSAIAGTVSSGDEDGSDNWETLCAYIKEQSGTAPDISNFPAFNYAANYATYAGLSGTWASDWYLPSAYELYQINKNYDKVKAALSAAGGDALATSAGDAVSYWTSSQMPEVSSGNSYYNTYKEEVLCVNVDNATEYSHYIDKNSVSAYYYPRPIRSF